MTTQPKLVNKQFNSPIGLYSDQNVREVLQREQQMLANGAIGIDFHNSATGKPANLQNSAVLRMLEEEENRRGGRTGNGEYYPRPLRDVSWPPPDHDQKTHTRSSFKDVVVPGAKRVAWPPPQEGVLDPAEAAEQNAVQSQGGPHYSNQTPGLQQNNYSPKQAAPYQQPYAQQFHRPLKPLDISSVGTSSPLASPALNQTPQAYRSPTPAGPKGWAPVQSPTTPLGPGSQKYFGAPAQGYQSQPQYQPVAQTYQQTKQTYREYQTSGQYQQSSQQQYQPVAVQSHQQSTQQYQSQQHQQPAQQQWQQPSQLNQPGSFAPQQQQQPAQSGGFAPQQYQSQPGGFAPQQQQQSQPGGFAPQHQQQPAPQQYQSQSFAQSAPHQNQAPPKPVVAQTQAAAPRPQPGKQVEPPPSTITLRPAAPVSQAPPSVYSAQPATASLRGGKHLRGDLKWPPENVRQRMTEEQIHLMELAKGPACRPTRKDKDYTPFFEAHALNSTYPGYKIPPGTQFFRPEYQ